VFKPPVSSKTIRRLGAGNEKGGKKRSSQRWGEPVDETIGGTGGKSRTQKGILVVTQGMEKNSGSDVVGGRRKVLWVI